MASNLRVVPQSMAMGSPQQQGWVWNGTSWVCDPCCDGGQPWPTPPPCPPSGFPTPCPPWFPPPAGQAPWYPGANGGVSFSATPPVNPVRGNLWWDGTVFHLFDGAAWVDIGPVTTSQGVTDGSNASPGQVGEWTSGQGTLSYPASPSNTISPVSVMVIQPGDWDIHGYLTTTGYCDGLVFNPFPSPIPGLSGTCQGALISVGSPTAAFSQFSIVTGSGRGNFSVPTMLAFNVQVYLQTTSLPAGTATMIVWARRMR